MRPYRTQVILLLALLFAPFAVAIGSVAFSVLAGWSYFWSAVWESVWDVIIQVLYGP